MRHALTALLFVSLVLAAAAAAALSQIDHKPGSLQVKLTSDI